MQHSAAVMGVIPMTPEMWRRNSSPSNTDAMCNLLQFAKSLGKRTVSPCYCNGIQVLLWEIGSRSPSVVLVPRLGGMGHQLFPDFGDFGERCFVQPAPLKVTGTSSVLPHARRVVEIFSTASGPVSTALRSRSGAAFRCWLGPWLHAALLCCNGPRPHDPRDVA